jgi:hypothetical protein
MRPARLRVPRRSVSRIGFHRAAPRRILPRRQSGHSRALWRNRLMPAHRSDRPGRETTPGPAVESGCGNTACTPATDRRCRPGASAEKHDGPGRSDSGIVPLEACRPVRCWLPYDGHHPRRRGCVHVGRIKEWPSLRTRRDRGRRHSCNRQKRTLDLNVPEHVVPRFGLGVPVEGPNVRTGVADRIGNNTDIGRVGHPSWDTDLVIPRQVERT